MAALIELGAGFHPEISGRENVFINGADPRPVRRAEIERALRRHRGLRRARGFIDTPVKNYSSGMYVRLGFSVAIHTDPEILLVDEVLAVGDEAFSHRCLRRIEEFLGSGGTLVLVSHDLALVAELCDRAVWLDAGELALAGHPRQVIDAYRGAIAEAEGREHQEAKDAAEAREAEAREPEAAEAREAEADAPVRAVRGAEMRAEGVVAPPPERAPGKTEPARSRWARGWSRPPSSSRPMRWGSRAAEIVAARLHDGDGQETYHLRSGSEARFVVEVAAEQPLDDFVFGIAISTPRGVECWGTNTDLGGLRPRRLAGSATIVVRCPEMRLAPGEYLVDLAIHARDGAPYDYRRRMFAFTVTAQEQGVGIYLPRHDWGFQRRRGVGSRRGGMTMTGESKSQTQTVNIKIGDDEQKGRYSNLLRIAHSREEFILDFINLVPPQGVVTARVITSPGISSASFARCRRTWSATRRPMERSRRRPTPRPPAESTRATAGGPR